MEGQGSCTLSPEQLPRSKMGIAEPAFGSSGLQKGEFQMPVLPDERGHIPPSLQELWQFQSLQGEAPRTAAWAHLVTLLSYRLFLGFPVVSQVRSSFGFFVFNLSMSFL